MKAVRAAAQPKSDYVISSTLSSISHPLADAFQITSSDPIRKGRQEGKHIFWLVFFFLYQV
jgi:hypothetical protein